MADSYAMAQSAIQAKELWDKALMSLTPEDRSCFAGLNLGEKSVLEDVQKAAKTKRDAAYSKRWTYKKGDRSKVVIRDVFEKIVHWITTYVQVFNILVNMDPVHFSPPWAAIRFLLQVSCFDGIIPIFSNSYLQISVSDVQAFGYMSEGLEIVTGIMARYTLLERLCSQASSTLLAEGIRQLKDSIAKVYANILIFLARAKKYWSHSTMGRVLKASFTNIAGEYHTLQNTIVKADDETIRLAHLIQHEYMANESDMTQQKLDVLANEVKSSFIGSPEILSSSVMSFTKISGWQYYTGSLHYVVSKITAMQSKLCLKV